MPTNTPETPNSAFRYENEESSTMAIVRIAVGNIVVSTTYGIQKVDGTRVFEAVL